MIVLAVLLFDNAVTSSRLDSHFVMEIKVQDLHKSFGKENIMDEKIPSLLGAAAAATALQYLWHQQQLQKKRREKRLFGRWPESLVGNLQFSIWRLVSWLGLDNLSNTL